MEFPFKEVYFYEYCKRCKHHKEKDTDDPCDECLSEPINLHSHKPIKFEDKKESTNKL